MLGTDHPLGRIGTGGERRQVARHTTIGIAVVVVLAGPAFVPRIEHVQRHQAAKVKAAIDLEQVARRIGADGHPLVISAHRIGLTHVPVTLCGGVMVRSAAQIRVVGDLMIIPDRDHRHLRVQGLKIGVATVGGVSQPVFVERDDVVRGCVDPAQRDRIGVTETGGVRTVFVNVIAEVNGVLRIRFCGRVIGVEITLGIQRAREHCELHGGHVALGQRAGDPNGRRGSDRVKEPVVVRCPSGQPGDVNFGCIAAVCAGATNPGLDDRCKRAVGRDFISQSDILIGLDGLCVGPDDDAIG